VQLNGTRKSDQKSADSGLCEKWLLNIDDCGYARLWCFLTLCRLFVHVYYSVRLFSIVAKNEILL